MDSYNQTCIGKPVTTFCSYTLLIIYLLLQNLTYMFPLPSPCPGLVLPRLICIILISFIKAFLRGVIVRWIVSVIKA